MNTEEDLHSMLEIFPGHRTKMTWMDRFGYYCHMLYAKLLVQISGPEEQCWSWNCFKETSDDIEVAKLKSTRQLNIKGNISMSELSPGVVYEVLYVVKLKRGGYGWELPVTVRLSVPGETVRNRQVNLYEKIREQWIELNIGHFQTRHGETRQVCFHLFEHGEHLKKGLVIKGAIVRPKRI